jgi:iron(III) transport system ATP-binding protein
VSGILVVNPRQSLDDERLRSGAARPRIRVRNVSKSYATSHGSVQALSNVSVDVNIGEKLVLLGPSGCGKTTLLRCVAGLETPDDGQIEVDGQVVFSAEERINVAPELRNVGMVFQSYALWPHMRAFDNVAFPLQNLRRPQEEIRRRVTDVLQLVGCADLAERYPGQLSGGQQQRIALARAVVGSDTTILFDEPLSNVDTKVREQLRLELVRLQKRLGFSALYVTHDQTEALALGHRVAVMGSGRLAQVGLPREIYERPSTAYVADFTGAGNNFDGMVRRTNGDAIVVDTPLGPLSIFSTNSFAVGETVVVMIRPEHIRFADQKAPTNSFELVVESAMFLGLYIEYTAVSENRSISLIVRSTHSDLVPEGTKLWASIRSQDVRVFRKEKLLRTCSS